MKKISPLAVWLLSSWAIVRYIDTLPHCGEALFLVLVVTISGAAVIADLAMKAGTK